MDAGTAALGERIGFGATANLYPWGEGQVLKLFHSGMLEASVREEAAATAAAHDLGLPVPAMGGVIEVEGRLGIIYERVDGPTLLQVTSKAPWRVGKIATRLAELHADVNARVTDSLPPLRRRLRWQIERAPRLPAPLKDQVLELLDRLGDGDRACHFDFHPDNVIATAHGPIIIDWMNGARGEAAADFARTCLMLGLSAPPAGRGSALLARFGTGIFLRQYRRRYLQLLPTPPERVALWRIPVAAARLLERRPPGENERLVRLVADGLAHL
jgi:Ser/Thr protein kinase RdoA (MazF antagonist)